MSTIPDLQFDYPSCPVCDETLSLDGDTWECSKCELMWLRDGTHGESWNGPDEAAAVSGEVVE